MVPVCPTALNSPWAALSLPLGEAVTLGDVSEQKKRRRVLHTAGLTASALVLALSVQSQAVDDSDGPPPSYGDATILDPDATD